VYTQCPDCATVFRVTAEALKAAQGDVRCGVCATTFNALENLSEQPFKPAPAATSPSPDDSMTVEELPGGENIELETASPEPDTEEEPDSESASEEFEAPVPVEDDEDRALEFHGDAADLDKLFVIESLPAPEPPDDDLDPTDEHPILVLEEKDEPLEEPPAVESIVLETPPEPPSPPQPPPRVSVPPPPPPEAAAPPKPRPAAVSKSSTSPRILIPDEIRKRLAREAEERALAEKDFEFGETATPFYGEGILAQRWPWVAGIAVLALALVVQVVHSQRNDLVKSPALGPAIAGAYSLFGLSPLAPTDLSAYELRQWGAASDPNEAGRLLLRASIVNRATYAQPLPLLRLALQDRFGGTLQLRDIGPADYLPGAGVASLLEPGERADAVIRIVDPGPAAVGFELDVCLPAQGGVRCASQITAARQ
jgi:predicted Zn finger-like uncharacterized protein